MTEIPPGGGGLTVFVPSLLEWSQQLRCRPALGKAADLVISPHPGRGPWLPGVGKSFTLSKACCGGMSTGPGWADLDLVSGGSTRSHFLDI